MQTLTNNAGIPLSVAVFLATDNYDHDENVISVTTLIKPIRQVILGNRVPPELGLKDVEGMVNSRMGSAIHDGIETSWTQNHIKALTALGYPKRVIQRVKVNPNPDELEPDDIPVYLEQRAYREVEGRKISGKFDFVGEGRVEDFKTTSVYTYVNSTNDDKYILQGSLYRWLNPKIITQDTMAIQFIFTDWSAMQARGSTTYPAKRTVEKVFKLKPVAEIDAYVTQRVRTLNRLWNAPESELPLCGDEDLWRSAPQWKYYKNPANTSRSTKNFDNKQDAFLRMSADGNVGKVVEVPGQVKACRYCPAFSVCTQKDQYIATGELQL